MIEKIKEDITNRISLIQRGDFNIDDVRLLFIDLRASIDSLEKNVKSPIKDSQIYGIFDFVAHPNSREKGKTFKVSETVVEQFVTSITQGGSVNIQLLDLRITESLKSILEMLDIPYNQGLLEKQEIDLLSYVYHLIDGVVLNIKNNYIESAQIVYGPADNHTYIEFKVKPFNNKIGEQTISGSPTMRFRLL